MELVLLADVQANFASNWVRVANTSGLEDVRIKDRFREKGFGPGSEELEVDGIDISPVAGFSRLFFNRAAHATQPAVHRLGAVLELVGIAELVETEPVAPEPVEAVTAAAIGWEAPAPDEISEPEAAAVSELPTETAVTSVASEFVPPVKRRGRPPGVKNKPKELAIPGF